MTTVADDRQDSLTSLAEAVLARGDVLDRLAALQRLAAAVDAEIRTVVADARASRRSWSEIGTQLGVSKQAAAAKFGSAGRKAQPPAESDIAPLPNDTAALGQEMRVAVPVASSDRDFTDPDWVVKTRRGRTLLRITRGR